MRTSWFPRGPRGSSARGPVPERRGTRALPADSAPGDNGTRFGTATALERSPPPRPPAQTRATSTTPFSLPIAFITFLSWLRSVQWKVNVLWARPSSPERQFASLMFTR